MEGAPGAARPVVVERSLCSRFRTPRSACAICAALCPVGAIRIGDEGAEIVGSCHGCGVCFAACPNGAFRIDGRDDRAILARIRDRCASPPAEFRIRCARGDAPADLVVPCLGRVTEALLLEPLRLGATATELLEPPCELCPSARAVAHLEKVVGRTRALCGLVGRGSDAIRRRPVPLRNLPGRRERPVTRRDFLGAMRAEAMGLAAASLPPDPGPPGGERRSFRDLLAERRESPKRLLLVECLRGFHPRDRSASGAPPSSSPIARTIEVPSRDGLVAAFEVTRACTACGVCATLCPTGALTTRWTDDDFVLEFRPWACTGCQVCVVVCAPRAIRPRETARLDSLLGRREVPLLRARKATCRVCRAAFPADGAEICPLCADQQEKRLAGLPAVFKEREPCVRPLQASASTSTASSPAST